ncbi:MAG: ABC transporter substrate-binding protein [Brachymonas sp.]
MTKSHPNRRSFLLNATAVALAGTAVLGCRNASEPTASVKSENNSRSHGSSTLVSVTDFRGVSLNLKKPAQRVVCLLESALSGLYMLGAQHSLVGVPANVYSGDVAPHYAMLDSRLANKGIETPGNWDFMSLEKVIALKPDVAILWAQQREGIAALEARGIPVYGVFIDSLRDLEKEINDFAFLTGTENRAKALLEYTQAEVQSITALTANIPAEKRPKVYFAWGQGMLETACKGSIVNDLIHLAGGINTCVEQIEHGKPSLESILKWNPDVIMLWPSKRRSVVSVLDDEQWRNVSAIRNRRVYELPEVFFSDLWTLKFQFVLRLMAHWLHPSIISRPPDADLRKGAFSKLYGFEPL